MSSDSKKLVIRLWEAAIIVLATVVVYLPAVRGGFVFDDSILLAGQPLIRAADGLSRIWFSAEAPDYYPVSWTCFWLQWHLWGANPLPYHIVNVLLHAANAVLVVVVLRRFIPLQVGPVSLLAGLIFAVHPVNVAAVAWISEQKTTLAMLFFLLSVLAWLRFERETRGKWYAFSLGCFLLSLLAKPAAVMWPIVMLGMIWWRRKKLTLRDLRLSLPFLVLSLAAGLAAIWFQSVRVLGGEPARTDSFLARLVGAGWAVWFYVFKAVVPVHLSMLYPRWEIDVAQPLSYVPAAVLLLVLAYCWKKRKKWGDGILMGAGYYILMLFPVLGFFDQGFYRYSYVADHWQYFPLIGIVGLLVIGAGRVVSQSSLPQQIARAFGVVIVSVLGLLTWNQSHIYLSEETLWRDTIAKNPGAWLAHYNLGVTLAEQGRVEEATAAYENALRAKPDDADALGNLGMALAQQDKLDKAVVLWQEAVRVRPDNVQAHNNLGAAYAQRGDFKKAAREFSIVLLLKPDDIDAHANLGTVYLNQGKLEKAIDQFRAALQISPQMVALRLNLGMALMRLGRVPEAAESFQQVLHEDPTNETARVALEQLDQKMQKPHQR